MNILRTWENGVMTSESKQILSSSTVMYDEYRAWQLGCCDWTQRLFRTWYEGSLERDDCYIPRKNGAYYEWFADGRSETNLCGPDDHTLGRLNSFGDQGAMTVSSTDNSYRTQIINASTLKVEWNTNGGHVFQCPDEDDIASVILWYRDGNPFRELPWFVGSSVSLEPGKAKTIGIQTPVDTIWKLIGIDKCFGCSSPCWLAGWPKPAPYKKQTIATTSSYDGLLRLKFEGEPGVTYALKQSGDLRTWWTGGVSISDFSGSVQFTASASLPKSFFKIEAMQTTTMNAEETRLAIQDLKGFWK
jgi:hypothetical protein